ncbi:2-succinylbenzoate--CoA ligase [Oscillatoria sp. FACHB-1407]|uniref:2-succinylbenzoate--CoA ligase n=1 Tax=Oscillatoria sp. FACHB-1407 TaxID=2692847 RepID=UPI0016882D99|nr:2-succinylbenzoate--CoA ligase [Oscillatoria sp. FACHB-1407]MBD2459962.1 2-succinylbenzoate--CoA ligase [Oscillatoria sp. FACHB-1407]
MAEPLVHWQQRCHEEWLLGVDPQQIVEEVERRSQLLTQLRHQGILPRVLLVESDPVAFLAGCIAACVTESPVFLGNPHWAETEWQQVWQMTQPHIVWSESTTLPEDKTSNTPSSLTEIKGDQDIQLQAHSSSPFPFQNYLERQINHFAESSAKPGWIMIPTGGSSGRIRFVIHTWETLMASVQGFQQHFQVERVNSCCVLPLYHVSGFMQFLRSFTSGGQLAVLPFKDLKNGIKPCLNSSNFFLSLVPTQLQFILQNADLTDWLIQFQTVLLGGAPASEQLLEIAREKGIRLAPTYGMTETASQVATLTPEKFLQGHRSSGHHLPHARITILDSTHQVLMANEVGIVAIQAESLALGYYPNRFDSNEYFNTDDLGFIDDQGELHIVGRNSEKIITGGENVFPVEVESAILATGLVTDVCVFGISNPHWGEVIVAVYVPQHPEIQSSEIQEAIAHQLSRFKHPKQWIAVSEIPRNPQGKINRQQFASQII